MEPNTIFSTSETLGDIAKALLVFQSKVATIKRDGENPHFKSKFATLDNIIEGIKTPLAEAKLAYTQFPAGENMLVTVLMHENGEWMQSTVKMLPVKSDPQGQGSAITYMRRYSLAAMLGLATEVDDDGNAASGTTKPGNVSKAPEAKIDPLFEKAKKNLAANTDKTKLADFKTKIVNSKKYNDAQKAELILIIDAQIKKSK